MGHELDGDTTPIAAGLDFALRKSGGYLGAAAVQEARAEGCVADVVTILFEDLAAVPLGHEPIYSGETIVGETSSAAVGYRVGCPVALGRTHHPLSDGAQVSVDIAGERFAGRVVIGAAFDPDGQRMRSCALVDV